MLLSLVFVRSYNFGWSPVYDCKAYLETNTVKNCSYFGFGGYFLVLGTIFWSFEPDKANQANEARESWLMKTIVVNWNRLNDQQLQL